MAILGFILTWKHGCFFRHHKTLHVFFAKDIAFPFSFDHPFFGKNSFGKISFWEDFYQHVFGKLWKHPFVISIWKKFKYFTYTSNQFIWHYSDENTRENQLRERSSNRSSVRSRGKLYLIERISRFICGRMGRSRTFSTGGRVRGKVVKNYLKWRAERLKIFHSKVNSMNQIHIKDKLVILRQILIFVNKYLCQQVFFPLSSSLIISQSLFKIKTFQASQDLVSWEDL